MTWTTPKTWTTGDVLTAADMNTYVRDNTGDLDTRITALPDPGWVILDSGSGTATNFSANITAGYNRARVMVFVASVALSSTTPFIRVNGSSSAEYQVARSQIKADAVNSTEATNQTSIPLSDAISATVNVWIDAMLYNRIGSSNVSVLVDGKLWTSGEEAPWRFSARTTGTTGNTFDSVQVNWGISDSYDYLLLGAP